MATTESSLIMQVEEVRDIIVSAQTPSEAVEMIEGFLAGRDFEALHALVWLAVINHYRLNFNKVAIAAHKQQQSPDR